MSIREHNNIEDLLQSKLSEHEVHEGRNLFPYIQKEIARKKRQKVFLRVSYIAASLLILFTASLVINRTVLQEQEIKHLTGLEKTPSNTENKEQEKSFNINAEKEKDVRLISEPRWIAISNEGISGLKIITLPDGSEVTLKPAAKLFYLEGFGTSNRTLKFSGTAFFDVNRNENIPFVITTDNSKTTVLGTSFCIDASGKGDKIYVTSGLVEFSNKNSSQKVLLEAGEKGSSIGSEIAKGIFKSNNFLAWKTGEMVFDEDKIENVIPVLESFFNKKIILENPALKDCSFSGSFNDPQLNEFMAIFSLSLNIQYSITEEEVLLNGKGCDNL